ncbi:hypothetical protein LINPERPRIM_LOCUS27690 [Linum perenne]
MALAMAMARRPIIQPVFHLLPSLFSSSSSDEVISSSSDDEVISSSSDDEVISSSSDDEVISTGLVSNHASQEYNEYVFSYFEEEYKEEEYK